MTTIHLFESHWVVAAFRDLSLVHDVISRILDQRVVLVRFTGIHGLRKKFVNLNSKINEKIKKYLWQLKYLIMNTTENWKVGFCFCLNIVLIYLSSRIHLKFSLPNAVFLLKRKKDAAKMVTSLFLSLKYFIY